MDAIRSQIPPSICDLNPSVPFGLAQVIHRALAKQPYHRLSSANEFCQSLQRALANESLPQFDRLKIAPRISRIKNALGQGDSQYAKDLIFDLQAEGHIDPEITVLRIQVEEASRGKLIHRLLDSVRFHLDEEDYPLALEKIDRILDLDPANIDALALKREVKEKRSTAGIEKWYQIACQHRTNRLYAKAREAIAEILKIDPNHEPTKQLSLEIKRDEQEQLRLRGEMHRLYESALKAYGTGEISTALTKLERIIELGKRVSGQSRTNSEYERLYNQVRLERDQLQASYGEARAALEAKDLKKAQDICKQVLERRPHDALFKALQIEVDESERQIRSAAIAEFHARVEAEADLEAKFQLAKEAVKRFEDEQTFADIFRLVKQKRDLVNTIAARAREYEARFQFAEARNQWDILRNIYPRYPGLNYEIERVEKKQRESVQERIDGDIPEQSPAIAYPENVESRDSSGDVKDSARSEADSKRTELTTLDSNKSEWRKRMSQFSDVDAKTEFRSRQGSRPEAEFEGPEPIADEQGSDHLASVGLLSGQTETPSELQPRFLNGRRQNRRDSPSEERQRSWPPSQRLGVYAAVAGIIVAAVVASVLLHNGTKSGKPGAQKPSSIVSSPKPAMLSAPAPVVSAQAGGSTTGSAASGSSSAPGSLSRPRRGELVTMFFNSSPPAAQVMADRKSSLQCETPCSLDLPRGEHTVVFSAWNRDPITRTITVSTPGEISADLPPATGSIEIISNPPGLNISIDGTNQGQTPLTLRLTTGRHEMKVSGNAQEQVQTIEVGKEEEGLKIITINLTSGSPPRDS